MGTRAAMGEERPRSSGCPSWNTATSFSFFFAGLHPLFGYLGLRNLRQLADPMCQPQLDHPTRQGKFLAAFQRGECSSTLKVLKDDQGKMSPPDDLAFFFCRLQSQGGVELGLIHVIKYYLQGYIDILCITVLYLPGSKDGLYNTHIGGWSSIQYIVGIYKSIARFLMVG